MIINHISSRKMYKESVQQATVFILAGKPSAKYTLNFMLLVIEFQ